MNPIRRGELEHNISSATVVFLNTGETKVLETKTKSACHFFEPFEVENDIVKLRLDWSDIDKNGNPTLDADFFDSKTGSKRTLKKERGNAHHSTAINTSEGRIYEWEFKGFRCPFKVIVCWTVSLVSKVKITDTATAVVIRKGKKIIN